MNRDVSNSHPGLRLLRQSYTDLWGVLKAIANRADSREQAVTRHVEHYARRGDPQSVIDTMNAFAQDRRFPMSVSGAKKRILLGELVDVRAQSVLELGGYCGYTAVMMGAKLLRTGGHLISIESSTRRAELARRVVEHAGLEAIVDIQVGSTRNLVSDRDGPFDLVFIDQWHDDYLSDLLLLETNGLLRPGTRIVADNAGSANAALETYLTYVRQAAHMESTHYASGMTRNSTSRDGVEVSVWSPTRTRRIA